MLCSLQTVTVFIGVVGSGLWLARRRVGFGRPLACGGCVLHQATARKSSRRCAQVARALGCDDDEDMDEADDAGDDADYGPNLREEDGDDDAAGNGTTDAGADTDGADAEGISIVQHCKLCSKGSLYPS